MVDGNWKKYHRNFAGLISAKYRSKAKWWAWHGGTVYFFSNSFAEKVIKCLNLRMTVCPDWVSPPPKSWARVLFKLVLLTLHIAPTIISFSLLDALTPAPAALTHYWLATRIVFWSEPPSVASTGSILKQLQIETFIASLSSRANLVHNGAFGASDGIKSNMISINNMFISYIGPPFMCLSPLLLNSPLPQLVLLPPRLIPTPAHIIFVCSLLLCHSHVAKVLLSGAVC